MDFRTGLSVREPSYCGYAGSSNMCTCPNYSVPSKATRPVRSRTRRHDMDIARRRSRPPVRTPNSDPRRRACCISRFPAAIPDPAPFRHRYTRLCDSGTPSALAAPTDIRPIAPPRPPPRAGPGHAPRPPCTAPQRSLWYARRIPVLPCITCSCFQCFQCFHARASLYHCFLRCNSCSL